MLQNTKQTTQKNLNEILKKIESEEMVHEDVGMEKNRIKRDELA